MTPTDAPLMQAMIDEPEVSEWWGGGQWQEMPSEWGEIGFVVEVCGEPAGFIQYLADLDPNHLFASVDIFVSSRFQGRGVGSEAMRTLIDYLFSELGLHRLTVDPAAANRRAVHVYEKLGFRRVGIMRRYERAEGRPWHDGLLMELLDEEWTA